MLQLKWTVHFHLSWYVIEKGFNQLSNPFKPIIIAWSDSEVVPDLVKSGQNWADFSIKM